MKNDFYESLACKFLVKNGHTIVSRNYFYAKNNIKGEIDIISKKDDTIFLNEVKKRSEFAENCVSNAQMQRIWAVWENFLEENQEFAKYNALIQLVLVVNNECNILEIL